MNSRKRSVLPQTRPFTIRLTEAERTELQRRAGHTAIGAYIKRVLFPSDNRQVYRGAWAPIKDERALARVLAGLGSSRVAEHLAALAYDARNGTLPVDKDTTARLHQACHDILTMRLLLMRALGLKRPGTEFSESFARASEGRAA